MALPQIQIGDGLLGTALLAGVQVVQQLNSHAWCTVTCRNVEDARVDVEALLGQALQVKTTDDQGVEHVHFAGHVQDVQLGYEVWGSYAATVVAVSDSYRLDLTAHKQYYSEGTLLTVAQAVGGRAGVTVAVHAAAGKPLNYVQYGETDFSFLSRVVDDAEAWMRPGADGGLEVYDSFQAGGQVAWRAVAGLTSFRLRGRLAPPAYAGAHYDHHSMQSTQFDRVVRAPAVYSGGARLTAAVESASQALPVGFEPRRARAMTLGDYNTQLAAESERALGGAVTGQGTSGNAALRAGDTVEIAGVLDAAGTYGLVRVEHRWTPAGYENRFECTPWKKWRSAVAPAFREWEGVVPARVVAHDDPKGMGRLRVQFFWQGDGSTHWARMVSGHAGPGRGLMMMPEVGDEVAVMFEDGDAERPVVVGSLWNGVQAAPRAGFFAPGADVPDNNVKRLLTKSGNRLQLVDTPSVETVVLATPHATKLHLTEKDTGTGRPLVHVHSDGDIVLSAPNGRVHVKSGLFSREVGTAKAAGAGGAAAAAAAATLAAPNLDGMSCAQKMETALKTSSAGQALMDSLGGEKGLAIMAGAIGGAAIVQAIPVAGEVEDFLAIVGGGLALLGLALSGHQVWRGLKGLKQFKNACCSQAKTPDDLRRAGQIGADAIADIGVGSIFSVLAIKPVAAGVKAVPRAMEGAPPTELGLRVGEPLSMDAAEEAASQQGTGKYPGVDRWTNAPIKRGDIVVGASPGQTNFYTDLPSFEGMDGSAESYYKNLQIAPNTDPQYPPFRDGVTVYQAISDAPAAEAVTLANPANGEGGAFQKYIPDSKQYLKELYSIPFKK